MSKYILGASSDIGYERESQEDFVQYKELDNNNLLAVIADGTGSVKEHIQPAVMATMSVVSEITDLFQTDSNLFLSNVPFFLRRSIINANLMLGALKLGNEEIYFGYAASLTAVLLTQNNCINIAHTGNTRLYIMRDGKIYQLTKDHTEAQKLLEEGKIDLDTYYLHPSRLKLTSGCGLSTEPRIDVQSGYIYQNDLIVLTSDGIHYAIKPEAMTSIILESRDCMEACKNLIDAAKNIVKYPDNMSAIVICSA